MKNQEVVKSSIIDENKGYVHFIFVSDDNEECTAYYSTTQDIEQAKKEGGWSDKYPAFNSGSKRLGEIVKIRGQFRIKLDSVDYKENENLARMDFPTWLLAAQTGYLFSTSLKKEVEARPLPDDVTKYFTEEARTIKERRDQLLNEFREINNTLHYFAKFAEKYNVDSIQWITESVPYKSDKEIEDLVGWSPDEVYGGSEAPKTLIDYIYETWGKDAGRSYLAHLKTVLQHIDPGINI